jgi:hypothetical protein
MNKLLTAIVNRPMSRPMAHTHPLHGEAVRAYHLICIAAYGERDSERALRLIQRAADRESRRFVNRPCDVCGKPAHHHYYIDGAMRAACHGHDAAVRPAEGGMR